MGRQISMAKITQRERVLNYITAYGSITRLDAANAIGCFELASRIGELESEGHRFNRQTECSRNRYGDKVHYTRYTLAK